MSNEEEQQRELEDEEEGVESEDLERECRVCRDVAYEDNPLYKPCKCTGSIGWTHQECLQEWLKQSNSVKCELCGHTFQFTPQYAPNTPDRLPAFEVLLGVSRNFLATWLPLWLRISVAAALWLLVAPLSTALIYHGWMHGTMLLNGHVAVMQLQWNILVDELISGAVLVAIILFSFLSIMSFVDFLRAEWQDPRPNNDNNNNNNNAGLQPAARAGGGGRAGLRRGENDNNNDNFPPEPAVNERDVDVGIWNEYQRNQRTTGEDTAASSEATDVSQSETNNQEALARHQEQGELQRNQREERVNEMLQRLELPPADPRIQDENNEIDDVREDDEDMPEPPEDVNDENNNNNGNADVNLNDLMDDDLAGDADLNVALDELLGVRGPLHIVVRNLLWLMAFNTLYLAVFAFLPRIIGSLSLSIVDYASSADKNLSFAFTSNGTFSLNGTVGAGAVGNSTDALANSTMLPITNISDYSISNIFRVVEYESARLGTTFRLNDLWNVSVGYAIAAVCLVMMRYMWALFRMKHTENDNNIVINNNPQLAREDNELREALLHELNRVVGDAEGLGINVQQPQPRAQQQPVPPLGLNQQLRDPANFDDEGNIQLGVLVDIALDAASSIVKVGVLLFLKMFLLPVVLGFCLDISTISLFQRTFDEIVLYAGRDLFSFLFLHWVAGISFMLLVTVSVLQLREVAHPWVLAHIVRPQEPQPDLLGNLLHDPLVTHSKRLVLSLVIYALLLELQVRFPVQLFAATFGSSETMAEFWKLKFCYVLTPRLQIPMELCIFHLCMLSLLEKNKNAIGELQHNWLKFCCRLLALSNSMLPHNVEMFKYIGSSPVFADNPSGSVDAFWGMLAKEKSTIKREKMIEERIGSHFKNESPNTNRTTLGETNERGTRVIKRRSDYIRLPSLSEDGEYSLLPTKSGRYRLNRVSTPVPGAENEEEFTSTIELWVEVIGTPISRPPEGWDDLGAGGPEQTERWAWDRETKSSIEEGVARRTMLFPPKQAPFERIFATGKLVVLVVLSWLSSCFATSFLLVSPLVVGRILSALLRIPNQYVHDPFCFAAGSSVVFPLLRRFMLFCKTSESSVLLRFLGWFKMIRPPSLRKAVSLGSAGFLWFGFLPVITGISFDILFIWSNDRFVNQGISLDSRELLESWAFGNVILSGWSACLVAGVLTRNFWSGLFFNDGNRENEVDPSTWQGKMSRFWGVWRDVFLNWEWEKVDHVVLFDECILPVMRMLLWVLVVPGVFTMSILGFGWLDKSVSVPIVARTCMALISMLYMGMSCEEQVSSWFDAAHRTARDERYLTGFLLMNYAN